MIDALIQDGTVTLLALAILGIEALCLVSLAGDRAARLPILVNVLSGLCLILALRAAILDQAAAAIALWLGLGGIAHAVDTALRLSRRRIPAADPPTTIVEPTKTGSKFV